MTSGLAQRQIVLAAAALLAVVVALVLASLAGGSASEEEGLPQSVPAPGGGWYRGLAAPYRFPRSATQTSCGHPATSKTNGVGHPALPCGAKIYLLLEGRQVLTQVVDRGAGRPGREFDVTEPLARALGLSGIQPIEWRFARE